MIRIGVSVLNHGDSASTVACIESLLRSDGAGREYRLDIFVGDNGSAGDQHDVLLGALESRDEVTVTLFGENLGFSAGHNRNLASIMNNGSAPDFVWLLNDDCRVAAQTLTELVKCAQKRPEVGIWGATLLEPDGKTIQCAGGCFYRPWISSFREYGRGRPLEESDRLKPARFDYMAGASLFFPVACLQSGLRPVPQWRGQASRAEGEWLNEAFFLYFEELDLALRLKPGIGMDWCRKALVTHVGGQTTGTTGKSRSARAEYHSTLSALRFTRSWYPRRLWFMAPARYLIKGFLLLASGNAGLLKHQHRAYRDFLRRG